MRLKPLALGGAAVVALALSANASFAQASNPPPSSDAAAPAAATDTTTNDNNSSAAPVKHYRHHANRRADLGRPSSPAEREQTADLNKQQLAQADGQSPAANVAQNTTSGSSDNTTAMKAQTPQNMTQQNMAANNTAPAAGKKSLDTVQNPKRTLASAKVENSNGQQIGEVRNVMVGSNGKPQSVNVSLQGADGSTMKTVNVNADQLSYDQNNNVLITPLSQDQINALPTNPM